MITNTRKLSKKEVKRIKTLTINLCANYDNGSRLCLPADKECRMLTIRHANECCAYFQKAVLPTEPALLEALTADNSAADLCQKECKICGSIFFAAKNQVYCSPECRDEGEHEMNRKRVAQHRRKRKLF